MDKHSSVHVSILEPVRPTIFLMQPGLSISEAALDTALTFWRVRAVEEGNVLVADIAEPVPISPTPSQSEERRLTNAPYSYPQTVQSPNYAPVRHPISHRRNHPLYQDA